MPFASKEDKSAYMKVWRSKNAFTESYKKRGCGYVKKVGLYWHFVDLVWVFVFTFFYLV